MGLGKGFIMKVRVLLPLVVLSLILVSTTGLGSWTRSGDVTEHSYIHLTGYIDEMKIYQTDKGFKGQKVIVGTRGSGVVDRRQTAYVSEDEMFFNEWGFFKYQPPLDQSLASDLRNALCAKNYRMGTAISESYTNLDYLIKDTPYSRTITHQSIRSHPRGGGRPGSGLG